MDVNYSYYDINLGDIWLFEHDQCVNDKSSNDLAKKVIDKAEELIIKEGEVSFIVDLDNKESRLYYERNLKDYKKNSNTLKGRFETNYFFNKESCYQFDQDIIVKRETSGFDFWFALKLRQYDSKLIEIKNFLEFQLEGAFNKDLVKFTDFLKLEIKQYQDAIFNDRIIGTIDTWIKEKNTINRKLKGKYSSLRLRELNTNSDYLKKNSHVLSNVLKHLKAYNFIHEDTLFTDFIRIFGGNIIPKNKRIVWTGTNKDLKWFMDYLSEGSNKIEYHKHDKWIVANMCFLNKENQGFGKDVLRKASGDDEARKKLLESILAKI